MKKIILVLIIGIMIGSGIGAVAYSYTAKQVSFTPNDKSWNVKTVEEAINYLKNNTGGNSEKIQEYEDKIEELEEKIETYENKISTYESKINELESNASSNETKISEYETKISELEGKIETANKKIEKYEEQIEELSTVNTSSGCTSGSFTKKENASISIDVGFTPSEYIFEFTPSNDNRHIVYYNSVINSNSFEFVTRNNSFYNFFTNSYEIKDKKIIETSINTEAQRYIESLNIYYMACK